MEENSRRRINIEFPYVIMLSVNLLFLAFAFALDSPANIFSGLSRILTSRAVLVTDFIAVGGVSATLLNVSIVGVLSLAMLVLSRIKPSGAIIMALWLTAGFAFFGKNALNMLPLTFGVWLFAKFRQKPFANYTLVSLLVATLSPVVSEISFFGVFGFPVEIALGILFGFVIGFIFPPISAAMVKVHSGYDLYSMGFAGGLIALIITSCASSFGIDLVPENTWSSGNNPVMAALLYTISAALFCCGVFAGSPRKNLGEFRKFFAHSGRLITDFYFLYKNSIYINMGILCAFATTVTLLIGAELNGIAVAGIFTIAGFGSFGKHMKNVPPVLLGAVLSAYLNRWDFTSPQNVAAILFSAALAPLAGQFGWLLGIVAGFLHVGVALHVGEFCGGLNLYNNGFAAGFIAMFLLPLATISERVRKGHED